MRLWIYLSAAGAGLGWAFWTAALRPLLAPPGSPSAAPRAHARSAAPLVAAFLSGAGISGASLVWFGSAYGPIPEPALALATGAIVTGLVAAFTRLLEGDDPLV